MLENFFILLNGNAIFSKNCSGNKVEPVTLLGNHVKPLYMVLFQSFRITRLTQPIHSFCQHFHVWIISIGLSSCFSMLLGRRKATNTSDSKTNSDETPQSCSLSVNESLYVFDELGLKSYSPTGTGKLLTHVVFHPVQKSLNRLIQIDYTVRVQSLTGFNEE